MTIPARITRRAPGRARLACTSADVASLGIVTGSVLRVTVGTVETIRADCYAVPAAGCVDVRWHDPMLADDDVVIAMGGLL